MAYGRTITPRRRMAAAVAVVGGLVLGLLAVPVGAVAAAQLPPVAPEELVSSVLAAKKEPYAGTVGVINALGLPALPDAPMPPEGTSTARVWSNGDAGDRVQLPTDGAERTLVSDGATFWAWNSETRTVLTGPRAARPTDATGGTSDPAGAANEALTRLRASSEVVVDGTTEVADRRAYELVLTPKPTERTLLREIRIAVDAEKRIPLRVLVLGNGSSEPALQVGFTELTFGPQDPALFTFIPPPGATVQQRPAAGAAPAAERKVVGEGWDRVVITKRPADAQPPSGIGTPVTGPWGTGRLIASAIGSAIVTDDGRVAAGTVPEQILREALSS